MHVQQVHWKHHWLTSFDFLFSKEKRACLVWRKSNAKVLKKHLHILSCNVHCLNWSHFTKHWILLATGYKKTHGVNYFLSFQQAHWTIGKIQILEWSSRWKLMDAYCLVLIAAMVLQLVAWRYFPYWLTPQGTEQEVICFSCIGSDS